MGHKLRAITNQCEYVNESESTKTAIGLGATHRPGGRQWRQSRQGRPKQRDDRGVHVYMKTGAPMPKCLCKKANSHCSPANARCLPAGRSREVAEQTRCSLLAGGARRRRRRLAETGRDGARARRRRSRRGETAPAGPDGAPPARQRSSQHRLLKKRFTDGLRSTARSRLEAQSAHYCIGVLHYPLLF